MSSCASFEQSATMGDSGATILVKLDSADKMRTNARGEAPDPMAKFRINVGGRGTGTYTSSTTLSKTIDPTWNEEFVLSVKDPANSQLECSLWDWSGADDTTQQKFLGEVILNLAKLVPYNNTFLNQVFEIKQGKQHKPFADDKKATGKLKLGLKLSIPEDQHKEIQRMKHHGSRLYGYSRYDDILVTSQRLLESSLLVSSQRRGATIMVKLDRAYKLRSKARGKAPDPTAEIRIIHIDGREPCVEKGTWRCSSILSETIDPIWNETLTLSVEDPMNSQLECSLWDWSGADDTTRPKFLGGVILNLAKLVRHNNTFINQVFEIKQGKQHKPFTLHKKAASKLSLGLKLSLPEQEWNRYMWDEFLKDSVSQAFTKKDFSAFKSNIILSSYKLQEQQMVEGSPIDNQFRRLLAISTIEIAKRNYERFFEMPAGSSSLEMVEHSSAGISGWARLCEQGVVQMSSHSDHEADDKSVSSTTLLDSNKGTYQCLAKRSTDWKGLIRERMRAQMADDDKSDSEEEDEKTPDCLNLEAIDLEAVLSEDPPVAASCLEIFKSKCTAFFNARWFKVTRSEFEDTDVIFNAISRSIERHRPEDAAAINSLRQQLEAGAAQAADATAIPVKAYQMIDFSHPSDEMEQDIARQIKMIKGSLVYTSARTPDNDQPPEDDESILKLTDGSEVPAANIEVVLKKHLEAVEHVMVVGSGKEFLSCMLTLKTKGSEAAARGEDPTSLGGAKDELAPASLAFAQQYGSEATTVMKARTCSKFRGEGLLPHFTKANSEISSSVQQVRRFSILLKVFSAKTGELLPDGSLNRLAIKKQSKSIIDGMYQQKKK